MISRLFLLAWCFLSLSLNAQEVLDTLSSSASAVETQWLDQPQLERVWQASMVSFPKDEDIKDSTIKELSQKSVRPQGTWPTVIFVHGCAGMLRGEKRRVKFFSEQGYLVISPDSFARQDYPKSCRIFPQRAFMQRGTLALRNQDIAYAVEQAKALDLVDADNIYLVGHSEGAVVVTTIKLASEVNARVAESWTCQSQWPEYRGINAPENEPVLTLVSKNDPWLLDGPNKGNCDAYINRHNGSLSRVYQDEVTKGKHKVLDFPVVQQEVLNFMNQFRH